MADTSDQQLSRWVTLVSYDGFEFVVLREAACISGAIRRMLDPKSRSTHASAFLLYRHRERTDGGQVDLWRAWRTDACLRRSGK